MNDLVQMYRAKSLIGLGEPFALIAVHQADSAYEHVADLFLIFRTVPNKNSRLMTGRLPVQKVPPELKNRMEPQTAEYAAKKGLEGIERALLTEQYRIAEKWQNFTTVQDFSFQPVEDWHRLLFQLRIESFPEQIFRKIAEFTKCRDLKADIDLNLRFPPMYGDFALE